MGMCKPSGGKIDKVGYVGSLKSTGLPNTREDLYDENGKLLQQRWFGPDGRPLWDRDWSHKDKGGKHIFPHDHPWDYTKIPPRQDFLDDINEDYC